MANDSEVPRVAIKVMLVVLAAMVLLSVYVNIQRWRRDKLETVIVTPAVSPSPPSSP